MVMPTPEPEVIEPLHRVLQVRYICLDPRNTEYANDVRVDSHDIQAIIRKAPEAAIGFRLIEHWETTISTDGVVTTLENDLRQIGKARYFGALLMTAEQIENDPSISVVDRHRLPAEMREKGRVVMMRCRIRNFFKVWNHDKMALV